MTCSNSMRAYVPIEEDEGSEDFLHRVRLSHVPQKRTPCLRYWLYLTHGTLLLLCVAFLGLWRRALNQPPTLPYSPASGAVEYYKEFQPFKGTLNYTSIYRGPPSPEIDAAWIRVSTGVPPTRITKEQLLMLGEPDTPSKVKYRDEDGGGYMGALEVTHQLHCLDILRKSVYLDYYSQVDPLFKSKPESYKFHLDHCVDILRQVLMCSADVGIITFEWVKGFSGPYPNFSTKHQCRNFEKVISWGVDRAAKIPNHRVTRLDGEVDLSQVP